MMATADLPFVSVIVPVFNGGAELAALGRALAAQDYPAERFEVVIGDDGSTDDGLAGFMAAFPRMRVARQQRSGSYAARNAAAALSRADCLALTDADCLPQPDWLRQGIAALERQRSAVAAGAIEVFTSRRPSLAERYDQAMGLRQEHYALKVGFGATANLFVARHAFLQAGGFDGGLRSAGDQRLCQRLAECGHRLVYAPEARVRHPARDTLGSLLKKTVRVARGRARAYPTGRYYLPRILSQYPPLLFDRAAVGHGPGARAAFAVLHYVLEGARILAYSSARAATRLERRQEAPAK